MNILTDDAKDFFYKHAGYSYDPAKETEAEGRERGAIQLAQAEQYALNNDWEVVWEYDQEPCIGCDCGDFDCPCYARREHETFAAFLTDGRGRESHHILAALGSICEPSEEYRRVVNAELALEAMPA